MKAFEPATQPTNVGIAGFVVEVPIHENYRQYRIERILIIPTAGAAASSTAVVSTDSDASDRKKQIASFSGITTSAPVDHDRDGNGYGWDPLDTATGSVYVKVTPDAGSDNAYTVRIFIGGRP